MGDPPWELTSYVMRRDVYHCTAEELEEADFKGISDDMAIRGAIAKVARVNRNK